MKFPPLPLLAGIVWPSLALGLLSAGLIAISITLRGQPWGMRADLLVLLWFCGGMFGALCSAGLLGFLGRRGWRRLAHHARQWLFLPSFMAAGSVAFLIQNRIQAGGFDPNPDHPIRSILFGSLQTMAVFVISAPLHMLPWMAPALVLGGYLLLPSGNRDS